MGILKTLLAVLLLVVVVVAVGIKVYEWSQVSRGGGEKDAQEFYRGLYAACRVVQRETPEVCNNKVAVFYREGLHRQRLPEWNGTELQDAAFYRGIYALCLKDRQTPATCNRFVRQGAYAASAHRQEYPGYIWPPGQSTPAAR